MFGYIGPDQDELKLRELAVYRAYYCGLCRSIGARCNQMARLTLSYDCSFLGLLLSAANGCGGMRERRCAYKPLSRMRLMAEPDKALDFAADINLLLAWSHFQDDWRDERRAVAGGALAALRSQARRAKARQPEAAAAIEKGLSGIAALERENCPEPDAPANLFAQLMRDVMRAAPIEDAQNRHTLPQVMYHLGRWIYLMDACEDREKDRKKGCYNPFNAAGAEDERIRFLLNCSHNEAIRAMELVNFQAHQGLIENIICGGCTVRMEKLFGGKHEQSV